MSPLGSHGLQGSKPFKLIKGCFRVTVGHYRGLGFFGFIETGNNWIVGL